MMPLTVAMILPNRTLWEQAHSCIQTLPVRISVEQDEPTEADALLDRIERHRVDVVLVEANRISLPLEEFIRRLHNTPAQPAVFVFHAEATPQLILEALRAGANEFLFPPLGNTLRAAFEKVAAERSQRASGGMKALGKIYGFLSARGGCGATTFAIHVATDLARQMRQSFVSEGRAAAPVLLADLDFEAGLLRFLMKSKNIYSVRDALDNMHRMDSSYWKAVVSSHGSLDFIAAPDEVAAKRPHGPEEMTHLMRFVRSMYPVTVVDFGRSVSAAALNALPELETLYLVSALDADTLEHAKRAIGMMEERGFGGRRIRVLLNRTTERGIGDPQALEHFLGHQPAGTFTNDSTALYEAYSEGHLMEPDAALAKELHKLAKSILTRSAGMEEVPAAAASGGRTGNLASAVAGGPRRWLSFFQKATA